MEMLRRLVLVLGLALPCSLLSYPKSSQLYYLFWGVFYAIVFPYYFFLNITLKEHFFLSSRVATGNFQF